MINIDLLKRYIDELSSFNIDVSKKSSTYSIQMSIFSGMYTVICDDLYYSLQDIPEQYRMIANEYIRVYKEKREIYDSILRDEMNKDAARCASILSFMQSNQTEVKQKEESKVEESKVKESTVDDNMNDDFLKLMNKEENKTTVDLTKKASYVKCLIDNNTVAILEDIRDDIKHTDDEKLDMALKHLYNVLEIAHDYYNLSEDSKERYVKNYKKASDINVLLSQVKTSIKNGMNYKG